MPTPRELHLVELVSPSGDVIGSATVAEAHTAPGALHRAFSVLLFDADGRTLLQQRAEVKTRFPLHWANACCGHPAPGEAVDVAATRRLAEELGLRGVRLAEAGVHTYRAVDPTTGRVEHEYDHVLVGLVDADLSIDADPAEVATTTWVPAATDVSTGGPPVALPATLGRYAPWLPGVLAVALTASLTL